jgi:type IV secretion system protein VirD4
MTVLGEAAWNEAPGYPEAEALNGRNLVLGRAVVMDEADPDYGRAIPGMFHAVPPIMPLLTVAGPRTGKGVSHIIPALLTYAGSMLVLDPKGENYAATGARRRRMGQKVFCLDPWNEANQRYPGKLPDQLPPARFNPMSILDPLSPDFTDDVAYLAEALIITHEGKNAHFDDSARDLVAGLIAYAAEDPETREYATLGVVRVFLAASNEKIRSLAAKAAKLPGDSLAARKLARFNMDKYSDEIDSVLSTARTQTAFLDSPILEKNMEASDFSFDDLGHSGTTIYVVLAPDKIDDYARWLRLMVSAALRSVIRARTQPALRTVFILDEMGSLGRLPALARAYSLLAGLNCICWGFLQNLTMLKKTYPEDWELFLGSCQAITIFGLMDDFTAEYFSKMLGTTTVVHGGTSTSTSSNWGPQGQSGSTSTTVGSPNYTARRLCLPEEIRQMAPQLGIIISRVEPIIFERIQYYSDPTYTALLDGAAAGGAPSAWSMEAFNAALEAAAGQKRRGWLSRFLPGKDRAKTSAPPVTAPAAVETEKGMRPDNTSLPEFLRNVVIDPKAAAVDAEKSQPQSESRWQEYLRRKGIDPSLPDAGEAFWRDFRAANGLPPENVEPEKSREQMLAELHAATEWHQGLVARLDAPDPPPEPTAVELDQEPPSAPSRPTTAPRPANPFARPKGGR